MTEKAVQEKVHQLTQTRKAKLGHLTSQANEINWLMEDDANVNTVKQQLRLDYQDSLAEFCKINYVTNLLCAEELKKDQSSWFEPKLMASAAESYRIKQRGSSVGSKVSTASSARLKAEVERAALLAKAAALKQKQDLERQEAELKAKREALHLQTAIAASDAKFKVLENAQNPALKALKTASIIQSSSLVDNRRS